MRRTIAALFLGGAMGTGAELLLLEHTEGVWQTAPLILLAAGCLILCMIAIRPGAAGVRVFQLLMALFVLNGIAGIVLHFQGNVEFERELQPDAAGLELFWEAMKGATPALAPGTMILLGGIGLVYTGTRP
jgi:hypothetical protein